LAPSLKAKPAATGPFITLGDLFSNIGDAASSRLARAPGPGQRVVFGAPSLQTRLKALGLHWANPGQVREIIVTGDGQARVVADRPSNNAQNEMPTAIAVLTRDVARGEEIGAGDVTWIAPPPNAPRDALYDAEALVGKTAKRALTANLALRSMDVMDTPAVKRGETVTLHFVSGGMRLSLRGRALGDGAQGAQIKVLNPQSNKVVEAIVEGRGQALVLSSPQSSQIAARAGSN
jgi:flagella basal body P-ring formation protein FlgA